MLNYATYRKFLPLGNGTRVMLRLLTKEDRESLIDLFQEAPEEDTRFLKQDVKDLKTVNYWIDHINYQKVLPLVAVDLKARRLMANASLHRGQHAAKHIGEIRIFVSGFYRNRGLGSKILDELIHLASRENLQWLKAEVVAERKKVIQSLRARGFQTKAILEDYFLRKDGMTHDVVLMMRPLMGAEAEF
jgi:L-amino acid N-acyltransferase YncA